MYSHPIARSTVKSGSGPGGPVQAHADRAAASPAPAPRHHLAGLPVNPPGLSPSAYGHATPVVQMQRDRSKVRHGDAVKAEDEARWKLHRAWRVPEAHRGQAVVGLPRKVLGPDAAIPIRDRLAKLPSRYRDDPHLERLLREENPAQVRLGTAQTGVDAAPTAHQQDPLATGGRTREALAALEFAEKHHIPGSRVSSAVTDYDFDVGHHAIDPFELPRGAFSAEAPDEEGDFFKRGTKKTGAYIKHTSGHKGGATGVLDTTYSHPDDVRRMDARRTTRPMPVPMGNRFDVRVPLEREYLADALAPNRRYQEVKAHRGSDPTKKWGPTDKSAQAARKRRYDERRRKGGSG